MERMDQLRKIVFKKNKKKNKKRKACRKPSMYLQINENKEKQPIQLMSILKQYQKRNWRKVSYQKEKVNSK